MAYENIKFKKPCMTVVDGYFYMLDESTDTLLQKTDDGTTSFTYPLDTLITNVIKSLEYDGVYFWSLEVGATNKMVVKRWFIDNYVCKLKQTINISNDVFEGNTHYFSSEAFSVEHYHTAFTSPTASGSTTIYMDDYYDYVNTSGTLHLGPNVDGFYEDVVVTGEVIAGVTIATPLVYDYAEGDDINFHRYIWLFNNFDVQDSSNGALYKLDSSTGTIVAKYSGGAYKDITASTFFKVNSFTEYGPVDTLCFVKASNLLFINVNTEGTSLPYYGSMVMDNIQSDETTILTVYDIAIEEQNIYRLQLKATYYGTTYTWISYNYQMAPLNSFVTSLALSAYPGIIAANLTSTTSITAIVKDQFGQPITGRAVYYTDDDSNGFIITTPVNTDTDGVSSTVYRSGNTAREVKITATVEQT